MKKERNILLAKYLRGIARYTLLVVFGLVFIVSLLSGSGDYGGGIRGIIQNSPNALPWLIFLILLFIAWKWEVVGGILITFVGFVAFVYFSAIEGQYFKFTFFMSLFIILFGSFFIISWYLDKRSARIK